MKTLVVGVALALGGAASVLPFYVSIPAAVVATKPGLAQPDVIRPGIKLGPVEVGGETPDEAARALRVWWEGVKTARLKVIVPGRVVHIPDLKPSELGVTLDDTASVRALPLQGSVANANEPADGVFSPVFELNPVLQPAAERRLGAWIGPIHPARVRYYKGAFLRDPEVATSAVEYEKLPEAVGKAVLGSHIVTLPMTGQTKHVSDDDLAKIKEVVTSFTTHFSTSKRTRCSNIKLAASIIDGTVLLPGERFSFNGVVGRRTIKAGFKLAGVYKNGQHDTGIGGGICQVSTTLYNSVLLADLPIYQRSNHSLPVPYVPLGQDATVDYDNLDLVFENTYPTPIAISSYYEPGRLTFRVLGQKKPGLVVKITRGKMKYVPAEVETVPDPKLPLGQKKVVKPGSSLEVVATFRLVYMDGKLVKKESLGHSRYGGMPRVVLVGTGNPLTPRLNGGPGATPAMARPGQVTVPSTAAATVAGGR